MNETRKEQLINKLKEEHKANEDKLK